MAEEFENIGAGSATVRPIQAGAVKKGGYCMMKGRPCKVVDVSVSKTGKHGHAKASITGIDLFTGKKYEENCPTSHSMEEPFPVERRQYSYLGHEDIHLHLLDASGSIREDLSLNDNAVINQWEEDIAAGKTVMVTVLSACNEEKVLGPGEK